MATVSAVLFPRKTSRNTYYIKIRISTVNASRYVTTGIDVMKGEWDKSKGLVKKTHPLSEQINTAIVRLIQEEKTRLDLPQEQVHRVVDPKNNYTLGEALALRIDELKRLDQFSTAKRIGTAQRLLKELGLHMVPLRDFNEQHALQYDERLKRMNISISTRITYHKAVKRLLTWSFENNLIESVPRYIRLPANRRSRFRRSLSFEETHLLFDSLNFGNSGYVGWEYRSIALFQFAYFSNGMRFGDVFHLKWGDLVDDVIRYRTSKTGRTLTIQLTPYHYSSLRFLLPKEFSPPFLPTQTTLPKGQFVSRNWEKCFESHVAYLRSREDALLRGEFELDGIVFDVALNQKESQITEEQQKHIKLASQQRDTHLKALVKECISKYPNRYILDYHRPVNRADIEKLNNSKSGANAVVNKSLNSVAMKLDLTTFSFHSSRHTFAHHLKMLNKDIFDISKALGHGNIQITQEYLREFSDSAVKQASLPLVETMNSLY